jgi:hypothetical protein
MSDSELHTIELSHGKPRLTAPRLTDLGTVPTGEDRSADHGRDGRFLPGNRAAADKSARRALTAPLRAARTRLQRAVEGEPVSKVDELLAGAESVYAASRRELGVRSTLVLGRLATHATDSVLYGYFIQRATEVGLETAQGAALLELAHGCDTRATRAMTAALAGAKALAGSGRKRRGKTVPAGFEAEEDDA